MMKGNRWLRGSYTAVVCEELVATGLNCSQSLDTVTSSFVQSCNRSTKSAKCAEHHWPDKT